MMGKHAAVVLPHEAVVSNVTVMPRLWPPSCQVLDEGTFQQSIEVVEHHHGYDT